jgi:hypothetical protein
LWFSFSGASAWPRSLTAQGISVQLRGLTAQGFGACFPRRLGGHAQFPRPVYRAFPRADNPEAGKIEGRESPGKGGYPGGAGEKHQIKTAGFDEPPGAGVSLRRNRVVEVQLPEGKAPFRKNPGQFGGTQAGAGQEGGFSRGNFLRQPLPKGPALVNRARELGMSPQAAG